MATTTDGQPATITVTPRRLRSDGPHAADCKCCDGPHVFGVRIQVDEASARPALHQGRWDLASWLHDVLLRAPDGQPVTITVAPATDSGVAYLDREAAQDLRAALDVLLGDSQPQAAELEVRPTGRAIPVPHDLVEPPTMRVHADGRTELEWTHGRGTTWVAPELLEVVVARVNDAITAEQSLADVTAAASTAQQQGAVQALRAHARLLQRMADDDETEEGTPSGVALGLQQAADEADNRADAIESGKLKLPHLQAPGDDRG